MCSTILYTLCRQLLNFIEQVADLVAFYFSLKKTLADYVQEIALGVENIITMKLSRRLFGISTDVFLICVYSAPLKSPLYSKSNFNNGISAVEHCLFTITEKYGNVPFLLCGDFNARTGNKQPYHVLDMEYFTTVAQDEQYGAQGQRRSQDSEENDFGKLFLELCTQFDLCLLNGACEGDERGLYTFVSATGNSVIILHFRGPLHTFRKKCV